MTKLLEENIGEKLLGIGHGNAILDIIYKAQRAKINKWCYIKLKSFCIAKVKKKKKDAAHTMEKMFVNHISNNGLISKIYKKLRQLSNKIAQAILLKSGQRN